MPLVGPLLQQADNRGRQVTLISLDLPTNGYASMIEHTDIAKIDDSLWNTGYPILDFIEDFVVAVVDELEALQPGFKDKIVGVIGGSLGGNMGLRLARRDLATHPWLHSVVSWSPASTWLSWARATIGIPGHGRFYDLVKHEGVGNTWGASIEDEVETPFNKSSTQQVLLSADRDDQDREDRAVGPLVQQELALPRGGQGVIPPRHLRDLQRALPALALAGRPRAADLQPLGLRHHRLEHRSGPQERRQRRAGPLHADHVEDAARHGARR